MDINAFKNPYASSLVDYLSNNKTSYFDSVADNLLNTYGTHKALQSQTAAAAGDVVSLSEEAQQLLASGKNSKANLSGVQKGAANLMISFFDQSGIDLTNISAEALDLIEGLQGVIGGTSATGRDLSTDTAEMRYAGDNKKVYTLVGEGQRLRVAIEYTDGKPSKLSLTDIVGGKVETAQITLQADEDNVMRMNVERTQRAYNNGYMVDLEALEPLSVKLYAAKTAAA